MEEENNIEEKIDMENDEVIEEKKVNLPKELKKTIHDKIKGRIVIFNAEKSEFAKNLKIDKSGDYIEKK